MVTFGVCLRPRMRHRVLSKRLGPVRCLHRRIKPVTMPGTTPARTLANHAQASVRPASRSSVKHSCGCLSHRPAPLQRASTTMSSTTGFAAAQTMAAIGSLVFCTDCGNLLDETEGKDNALLKCDICGALNKDTSATVIVTQSKPSAYPSVLRAKRSDVQQLAESDLGQLPLIAQPCEKCGRKLVRYYEQQLRGADEGSTIYYVCDCGNRFVYLSICPFLQLG